MPIIPPDIETITKALQRYDIGTMTADPIYIKGDVDLNYKIQTASGTYLLKCIVHESTHKIFELLGSIHEYLRKKEVNVPKVYKSRNGLYVQDSFILYEFIDGAHQKDWTEPEMISLVENFAKMLVALKGYHVPNSIKTKDDKYIRGGNIRYCHDVFRPMILELETTDEIKSPLIAMIDSMYAILPEFEKLPKSLIDGDLNEMNALFKDGKNVGIIDLALSYDPIVYDLGVFCYWFAFPWWTSEFNHARYKTILETFQKTIPLTKEEITLLPYMIMRRSMMDIMLTLQYYWTEKPRELAEQRLKDQIERNNRILELIKK